MSTTYTYENLATLVFKPDVDSSGALTLAVMDDQSPPQSQSLAPSDVVVDDADPSSLGTDAVTIHFEDSSTHQFWVTTAEGSAWRRDSSSSPAKSVSTREIPHSEDGLNTLVVTVVAKDPTTGATVAGPQAQIIILKRRPVA